MLFALDIFVNEKAPQLIVCIGVLTSTTKTSTPSFLPSPILNLQNI